MSLRVPMKSMSRRTFVAAIPLVGIGLSSPVRAQGTAPAEPIATLFQNVRVFDGKSSAPSPVMNVLVRGNTIERISAHPIPTDLVANTKIIAGGGRTLIPGLIDMHWHTMLVRPTPAELLTGDIGHLNLVAGAEATDTLLRGFVAGKPLPGSHAGIVYWGVHAFTGTNLAGQQVPFKFKVVPEVGEIVLSDEEAKSNTQFLVADLADRLAKGPVRFDILALLAEPGDDLRTDVTLRWKDEDSRKAVKLGTVSVTAIEANETCDRTIFDPGRLADGIGAPKDEIFTARRKAYGISLDLRTE
jgi:hypothetical protein